MLRFAADENFHNDIVRGIRRRTRDIDIVRVQDAGLMGAEDQTLLEWAAREQRLVLRHDAATFTAHAYERIRKGVPMPGVIEVKRGLPLRQVIDDILLLAECSLEAEWEGQVLYLPIL